MGWNSIEKAARVLDARGGTRFLNAAFAGRADGGALVFHRQVVPGGIKVQTSPLFRENTCVSFSILARLHRTFLTIPTV